MKRRWTSDELLQHFTLHSDELALLTSTTDHNRLGFAVLLKFFEYEGRFPQKPSSIPLEITGYIAKPHDVPKEAFARYDWQGRSIRSHRARIRQWLGFQPYVEADGQARIDWLCKRVLSENQNMEFLVDAVEKHLREKRVEPPTRASIERIIHSAIHTYEARLFDTVCDNLPKATRFALDDLLLPVDSKTEDTVANIPLHQIRNCRVIASVNSVLQAVERLEKLQQIHLPPSLFASVAPKIVEQFRQRAAVEIPSKLRRRPSPIRYTLLAAFCLIRKTEITDDLVECLIQIVHKMGTKAERKIYKERLEDLMRVTGKTNLLFRIAEVALNHPDGSIKEVI